MKQFLISTLVVWMLMASCTKDQRVVNKLDGKWLEVSLEKNGVKQNYKYGIPAMFEFNACNESKDKCGGVFYSPRVCFECVHPFYTYNTYDYCSDPENAEETIDEYEQDGYTCNITEEGRYNNYFDFEMSNRGSAIEMYIYTSGGVSLFHGTIEELEKNTMKLILYPGDGSRLIYELEREK